MSVNFARIARLAVLVAVVLFAGYLAGMYTVYRRPTTAHTIFSPFWSAISPVHTWWTDRTAKTPKRLPAAVLNKDSFTVSSSDPALGGTVLFAMRSLTQPAYTPRVVEVDRAGNVVWEYRLKENLLLTDVRKLDNGDVLLLGSCDIVNPCTAAKYDGTVLEVDRGGNVVRTWHVRSDHHAEILPNGNLLLADSLHDIVSEVDSAGAIVWKWDAHDHIHPYDPQHFVGVGTTAFPMTQVPNVYYKQPKDPLRTDLAGTDWTHVNSAQRLANGDTVISLHNFDLVVEVNQAGDVVWSYGSMVLKQQHCAFVLPNDHLLVFDNGNARVIEVDRQTQQIVWQYDDKLYAPFQGCAYRLASGNTLITDSQNLRVIEVTPDKRIVWSLHVDTPATAGLYRAWWSPS